MQRKTKDFYFLKVFKLNKGTSFIKKDKNGIILISFTPLYIKAKFLIINLFV